MNKIISSFIIFVGLCISLRVYAADPVDLEPEPPVESDDNPGVGRGRRVPPAPVMCVIDWEQGTISSDNPVIASVTDYQLWDEEASACIAASPFPADVLTYVSDAPGQTFILRLVTPSLTLRGYISAN